jgi:Arc/MetJ-type ribon-helix-helix transcriptional regulator
MFMAVEDKDEFITVSIPTPVCGKIEKRLAGTGFSSVSDYITFVLNEVVSDTCEEEDAAVPFTKEDEDNVKERLRALGYID